MHRIGGSGSWRWPSSDLVVGDFPVPAREAIATAIWDRGSEFDFVINSLRFPRITVAVLAGICLAVSGALFQALIDNPLVSPDIIGIDTGAAAFAVAILAMGLDTQWLPYAAFAGAVGTAALIFVLSWRRGFSGGRLVLVGIGINALLTAVITYMLVRFPIERVSAAARWQAGTLSSSSWEDARTLVIGLACAVASGVFAHPATSSHAIGRRHGHCLGCWPGAEPACGDHCRLRFGRRGGGRGGAARLRRTCWFPMWPGRWPAPALSRGECCY